ncbi:hypothetical protein T440DRAFT_327774 [Plenodomus tracheiphilus IPT5]|uniref:Uncharacterized protein n=1 Tax=Plenodomus tracheiphilus IPT5 TaxID=1408161 RepID=A0A6A7ANR2_9PLEO|nr:hypothetical protein T440DRAFT_327774 [Plenodomus tracheiphilus IPT5]
MSIIKCSSVRSELVIIFLRFIDDLQMMHNGVASPTAFRWEPEPEEQWEDENDSEKSDDDCGEEDNGGEQPRARPANPDGYWGTDRVRRLLRKQTYQYMGAALGTRAWRHAYLPIHRELAMSKRDFYPMFIVAWEASFKEATTPKAFEATGISPLNSEVIFKRF